MGTTTISLRDEAYRVLEAEKLEDESFSDVVLRLTESTADEEQIERLAGGLGTELATEIEESAEEVGDSLVMESGE